MEQNDTDFPSSSDSGSSPKHDGFLKSVWNKLTDNPSHPKDGSEGTSTDDTSKQEGTKDEKDHKKPSGTGV